MNVLDIKEIGTFIRKKRKEQGLRLEDLADERISTATISNIERGVPHVNKEKVIYLLKKMHLNIHEVPALILKDSEKMERMELAFTEVHALITMGKTERAAERLEQLTELASDHYPATIQFLKGKIDVVQKEWKRAERKFSEAIRMASQDLYAKRMQIEGESYVLLASCRYEQQEVEQALRYIEQGIASLKTTDHGQQQLIYRLQLDQARYLEKLGRTSEAVTKLNNLWQSIDSIERQGMILQMYRLQANLYRRMKLYRDAIECVQKGIHLSVSGENEREQINLWLLSAQIYLEVEQFAHAEICLDFVREIMTGHQKIEVQVYLLYTQLYLLQQRFDVALPYAQKGIEIAQTLAGHPLYGKMLLLYAQVLRHQKAFPQVIKCCQEVLLSNSHSLRLQAYFLMADCYRELGNDEQLLAVSKKILSLQKQKGFDLLELMDESSTGS